ncbi:hypothetical protein PLESTM_001810300 [Pleodorina starrii]|nr:hypothetical protein PLESTM_001810300 [Pleodorina starrii]
MVEVAVVAVIVCGKVLEKRAAVDLGAPWAASVALVLEKAGMAEAWVEEARVAEGRVAVARAGEVRVVEGRVTLISRTGSQEACAAPSAGCEPLYGSYRSRDAAQAS